MGNVPCAPVVIVLPGPVVERDVAEQMIFEHLNQGDNCLILDMSSINFVESCLLGLLIVALKRAKGGGGDLKLCGLQDSVRSVFQLVRLHRVFDMYDTVESAEKAFSTP